MDERNSNTTTVVCVGGSTGTVRSVCARVKQSGYRAIGIITEVNPRCTLPLLTSLSPDAIIVSDDLPDSSGKTFTDSLRGLYPDVRILLLADDHSVHKPAAPMTVKAGVKDGDVEQTLSALLRARA